MPARQRITYRYVKRLLRGIDPQVTPPLTLPDRAPCARRPRCADTHDIPPSEAEPEQAGSGSMEGYTQSSTSPVLPCWGPEPCCRVHVQMKCVQCLEEEAIDEAL
ncbi:hypothetical protein NDU88_003858 [Pleurodeles waltl]|uniref:Uncharacterized protein n=1 Tax=Pleurodeles waltl TaxID=8319 RepID=A0AAV7L2Z2_PLEWA|nr:hypothetical protein NDU88_003858 [Pleurodeles waltl]